MIDEGNIRSAHVNALLDNFHTSKPADLNDKVDEQNQFLLYKNITLIVMILTVGATVGLMTLLQRPLVAVAGCLILLGLYVVRQQIETSRQKHYLSIAEAWIHDAFIKLPQPPHLSQPESLAGELAVSTYRKNMEYAFNTLKHHAEKTAQTRPLDEYLSDVQDYIIHTLHLHTKLERAYTYASHRHL